ncbi:MAG: glycosyltransferase family 2 protein [bacterium]|nr:glycosyltransferase family 2 protein [bacterium]
MKKISVITSCYNEEETIRDVYEKIKEIFVDLRNTYEYEHIFMDNCSTDKTLSILKDIAANDKKIKILSYSKDFGPLKSAMVGYTYAIGNAVISFEANLKDPPELINTFIKYWEEGFDVVYGIRKKTGDKFFMRFMRRFFYWFCNVLSRENLPLNVGGFSLIDRKVVNELIKLDDHKPYTRGLITSIGFKQIGVEYVRGKRQKGKSKSDMDYLIDFAINAIISYSIKPIRFCTFIGMGLAGLSFLTAIVYFILKLFFWHAQIPAVSALIMAVLFFAGIQLFFLGIIGEYVGAIHSQVRKKPYVVIKEKINFDDVSDDNE